MKPILIACLFLAACAPAKLVRLSTSSTRSSAGSSDFVRAFAGATDEAAIRSLGQWIAKNHGNLSPDSPPGYRVPWHPGGPGIFPPRYFDRLEPAGTFKVRGLEHHRMDGTGVPLAGYRENRGRETIEKWYPPEGITRAVTAVAIYGPEGAVEIRLIDRMRTDTVTLAGKRQPLAPDFTVPFTTLLEKTGPLQSSGSTSVIRAQSDREPGFALMEPYDPKRAPLILIHGLFSTPLAWAELTNELWAVPAIRSRYQIWHYLYPTYPPALHSARVVRDQLDELHDFLDPQRDDPVAKTLAVDPRDAFWDAVFTRPLATFDLTPAEQITLREAFYWKPRGNVDRLISSQNRRCSIA